MDDNRSPTRVVDPLVETVFQIGPAGLLRTSPYPTDWLIHFFLQYVSTFCWNCMNLQTIETDEVRHETLNLISLHDQFAWQRDSHDSKNESALHQELHVKLRTGRNLHSFFLVVSRRRVSIAGRPSVADMRMYTGGETLFIFLKHHQKCNSVFLI